MWVFPEVCPGLSRPTGYWTGCQLISLMDKSHISIGNSHGIRLNVAVHEYRPSLSLLSTSPHLEDGNANTQTMLYFILTI